MTQPHDGLIWSRQINDEALARRWRALGLFYAAPTAIVLVIALALGGVGAFLGVAILFGVFGALLVALVFFKNLNARSNRTIELRNGRLSLGARHVELARLESWTASTDAETWGVTDAAIFGNPMAGNAITARVLFRLAVVDAAGQRSVRPDGGPAFEIVQFAWAEMPPDELHALTATLAQHLRAPFVQPGSLSS